MKHAGFNVEFQTSDYAMVAKRRLSKAPVGQGGWSMVPIVWNGIDSVSLADPAVSMNCSDHNPGWYRDLEQTRLLKDFSVATHRGATAMSPPSCRCGCIGM
jgi:peptide/nickel transport system substrate-binding protein